MIVFLPCTLKEKLPIFLVNTPLLHIPLLLGFFILEKQLASQDMFLVRSELFITAYLFLVSQKYRDVSVQVEIGE